MTESTESTGSSFVPQARDDGNLPDRDHAEDIKLSTLERFAEAIGKRLTLKIA
ncbi:MAG: hypothetical protein QGH15_15595 [Kiritimatiellia bacterium]|nr:hypothetical protein [Kiritimatiellia bacterium]